MGQNKGYLTAKTNKASDEYYTPSSAIVPLLKYISKKILFGVLLIKKIVNTFKFFLKMEMK